MNNILIGQTKMHLFSALIVLRSTLLFRGVLGNIKGN